MFRAALLGGLLMRNFDSLDIAHGICLTIVIVGSFFIIAIGA